MGNKLFKPYDKTKSQIEVVSKSNIRVPLWLQQHYIHTKFKQNYGFCSTHRIFVFLYLLYGKQKKKLENKLVMVSLHYATYESILLAAYLAREQQTMQQSPW
jgi:hypothetical protein